MEIKEPKTVEEFEALQKKFLENLVGAKDDLTALKGFGAELKGLLGANMKQILVKDGQLEGGKVRLTVMNGSAVFVEFTDPITKQKFIDSIK